jgi:ABC-type uncharacterized transport system involved in gliding motility auxiliary subunit
MLNRILNIVGWIGMALVAAAVAVTRVPALDKYGDFVKPLAIAGLVCVLAYTASQWREFAKLFARRQARYGTLTGASVLIIVAVLVAVNYIGKKQNKRWDLTTNKQFSLSDQTKNVLAKLDAPLEIKVFAQEPDFGRYQDRMREYEYASKKLSTEYIDPDKKPTVAKQLQIQQYGTIVLTYKGRTERVTTDQEQDITNGIIKVVSGQQRKVYFTSGHGEKDTAGQDRESYGTIAAALGRENYAVDKLALAQAGSVPDDASVVVVAGPRVDFLQPETDVLRKYLDKSGKLLLLLDPPDKVDSPPLTNLIALAHDWGVDVGNDVVVDVSGMGRLFGASEAVPVVVNYPPHPITEGFNSVMTAYPLARSVSPVVGGVNGRTAQPIAETSARSWAETDIKGLLTSKPIEFNEGKDRKGPITIAVAVSASPTSAEPPKPGEAPDAPKPQTRVVVFGDSDFASNATLGVPGNRDLFMNTVGWLSKQENLISIRPKEADDRRVTLTSTQQSNIIWLSLVVIPCFIFGTGIYTWWRRR